MMGLIALFILSGKPRATINQQRQSDSSLIEQQCDLQSSQTTTNLVKVYESCVSLVEVNTFPRTEEEKRSNDMQ